MVKVKADREKGEKIGNRCEEKGKPHYARNNNKGIQRNKGKWLQIQDT